MQTLGMPINGTLSSETSPSISGNGRTIILESTTGEDAAIEFVISNIKAGIWSRPEVLPGINAKANKLNYTGGHYLSLDGNYIYFSSNRYGGVGGADIWFMERNGTGWTAPKNIAKPVNSEGYDGDPCLSPDGKLLYFTRCSDKKGPNGQSCCKIFVAEKAGGDTWREAKELPAPINIGCEANPRILADNKTLLFASIRTGGKGGFDIYRSQLKPDGSWTNPEPMTFINTDKDDKYITVPASGDFLYLSAPVKGGNDLFKIKIPENLQPEKVVFIQGGVKDASTQAVLLSKITTNSIKSNKLKIYNNHSDGSYAVFLTKGEKYDFSVGANEKGYAFYSDFYDLDTLTKYRLMQVEVKLSPLKLNTVFPAKNIVFETNSDKVFPVSNYELDRIVKLLKDNPTIKIEINAYKDKIIRDSIMNEGLTELIVDTIKLKSTTMLPDSTFADSIVLKKTYHNDRTKKQANAVGSYLVKKGISPDRFTPNGQGDKKSGSTNSPGPAAMREAWIELKVIKE
jgi:outer membrane protein OmpA-like peptidoglycan-associated protein